MSRTFLCLVAVAALAGCATDAPLPHVEVPKVVYVPVDNSPVAVMPTCDSVASPAAGATLAEVFKVAVERMAAQKACIDMLRAALAPYTANTSTPAAPAK